MIRYFNRIIRVTENREYYRILKNSVKLYIDEIT